MLLLKPEVSSWNLELTGWGHAATCWSMLANAAINHGLQYDMVETTDVCLHPIET